MSAIAGIYYLDGRSVERADLGRMVDILAHRGPDGAGVWSEGPVGLGHRMLWTTPESLIEQLPLGNQTGDLVITADARIDNRDELIAALGLTDRPSEKITDSQLILSAYERWGESCPEHLLGDFAFGIWDGRKQVLFCARDHFGVKPFYYYRSGHAFIFTSEIKALLCLPEVPRCLNETRVADYLVGMLEDKSITLYQEILRLPPGHCMTAGRELTPPRPYWFLDPTCEIRYGSDEEYAEAFRDIFTEAVRCRLRSAFPLGSTLSGGLDSSSIVCVARNLLTKDGDKQLHTFSGVYDDVPACDERPYINAVLAQGGVEPHYGHPDRLSPLMDWESTSWHEDEFLWNPQMALHWVVYQAAQKQNVQVLLDGVGGDFVVSHGVAYLNELACTKRWITFMSETADLCKRLDFPRRRIMWHRGIVPLVPESVRQLWRTLRGRGGWNESARDLNSPIHPDFAQRIGLAERLASLKGERNKPIRSSRREHWLDLTSGLNSFVLEVADRTAALFRLEPRYPFFDRRLVEFCLALPAEQKMHRGWTRMIMRRALANILPAEVRWRSSKANLSPSFNYGLLAFDRKVLDDVILSDPECIAEYIDVPALRSMYQRYLSLGANSDGFTLWRVVKIALWLRRTSLKAQGGAREKVILQ